jgi:hypothetical protein
MGPVFNFGTQGSNFRAFLEEFVRVLYAIDNRQVAGYTFYFRFRNALLVP